MTQADDHFLHPAPGLGGSTRLESPGDVIDGNGSLPDILFGRALGPSGPEAGVGFGGFLVMPPADGPPPTTTTSMTSSSTTMTSSTTVVPRDLFFNDDTMVSVIAYSVLFFVAAFGNLTVFITLFRNRHRKSRVNLFIMHLSIADMIVTFVMIPMEIGWHVTVSWRAGDVACRLLMFCRPFGFYLSSFILVAISLDRYFAITHPMSISDADKRGRLMLLMAWLFSIVASTPQSVIFHVEHHPVYTWFTQCVTFNFYPTPAHELAYNLFNMAALYGVPLLIIIISYTLILWEISKKSRESREQTASEVRENLRRRETFRRSGIGRIEKARIRTLKMTIVIVLVFVACWTPYFVINAWFWFDKESAQKINAKVTRGLLIFAVSNSCVNPIVYGMFTHTFAREFKSWCCSGGRCRGGRLYETSSSSKVRRMIDKRAAARRQQPEPAPNGKPSQHASDACAPIDDVVASGLAETPCLGNVSHSTCSSSKMAVKRQTTPPHIAQGMGQKESFEKYFLI